MMEDIEVNTNLNVDKTGATSEAKPSNNILFKPTFDKIVMEEARKVNRTNINQSSVLNRSSMMTFSKM